jgi:hypothetical protein
MRKAWLVVALVAVVGCDSATAAGGAVRQAPQQARSNDTLDPWLTLDETDPVAVPSVRKVAAGLFQVRGLVEDGPVTVIVRTTAGGGFPTLTSGSEIIRFDMQGMAETGIQTVAGSRYLLIVAPGESDPALVDYSRASYIEFGP